MSQIESITQEFGSGFSLVSHNYFIKQLNRLACKLAENHSKECSQFQPTQESTTVDIQKIFASLNDSSISQIAIASNYIAILTSSNNIYRVKFRVIEKKTTSQSFQTREIPVAGGADSAVSSSDYKREDYKRLIEMSGVIARRNTFTSAPGADSIALVEHPDNPPLIRATNLSFARGGIRGLRPPRALTSMRPVSLPRNVANIRRSYLVANAQAHARTNLPPATEVPEDLIEQAQAVLQGKSRSVIIRELQRTGLDVNQAVNNLLSKDDDGDDEEPSPAVLTSDDILYLLESSGGNIPIHSELENVTELDSFPIETSLDSVRRPTREPRSDLEYTFNLRSTSDTQLDVPPIIFPPAIITAREGRESRMENLSPGDSATANSEGDTNNVSFAASINNNFDRWPLFSYSPMQIQPPVMITESGDNHIQEDTQTTNSSNKPDRQTEEVQSKKDKEKEPDEGEKDKETPNIILPQPYSSSPSIEFYSEVECWNQTVNTESGPKMIKGEPHKFSQISATDTELIAVTMSDYLAYWPWDLPCGYASNTQHIYPLCAELDIKQVDRIKFLASTRFRVAIATHTNGVASWPDRNLRKQMGNSTLDTRMYQLRLFPYNQVITSLVTSDIYSACLTSLAHVYWWGCMPLSDCKKAIQKVKSKFDLYHQSRDQAGGKRNQQNQIKEHSQVYMNESPYYTIGTKGLCIRQEAKIGLLQENVYSPVTSEKCRFKLVPQSEHTGEHEAGNIRTSDTITPISGLDGYKPSKKKHKSSTSDHSYGALSSNPSWPLKEVIFLEEPLIHSSQGEVLKVDGNYAVIHFKTYPGNLVDANKRSAEDIFTSCRIMKKDELILHRPGAFHKGPICIHLNPKRLTIDGDCTPLSLCADNKNLFIVYDQSSTVKLSPVSLESARFESIQTFSKSMSSHLLQNQPLILHINSLTTIPSFFMQDSKGSFLPLLKTESNSFKDIPFIPLPPLTCLQTYCHVSQKFLFLVMAFKRQYLIPHLIKSSPEHVIDALDKMSYDPVLLHAIPAEITNAKCNIIHTAIGTCSLQSGIESFNSESNKSVTSFFSGRQSINNKLKKYASRECESEHCVPIPISLTHLHPAKLYVPRVFDPNWGVSPASSISAAEPSDSDQDQLQDTLNLNTAPPLPTNAVLASATKSSSATLPTINSSKSQIQDDLKCLKILLDSQVLSPHMPSLLSQKNIHGLTPFMQAVHSRAYKAALHIFNHILKLFKTPPDNVTEENFLSSMIFPSGSFPDDNPLFMLCANDLCSITWTGETHETQIDIYECRTCGLTGDYCCCSECARVCHKGHDCTRKHPSANAFCDCKTKSICRAQNPGHQPSRIQLLTKLVKETKLTTLTNSSGEYILTFLATTHFRQNKEQDCRKPISRSSCKPGTPYLEPVRFAKQALEICLDNWTTLEAVLNGQNSSHLRFGQVIIDMHSGYVQTDPRPIEPNAYIDNQKGSMHIDAFIYTLFSKNSKDLIERLLTTICTAYKDSEKLAEVVIKRFCRSVLRILLVSTYELWASPSSSSGAKKKSQNVIDLAQYIFRTFHYFSMKEIWMIAQAIVTPIQLGVVKPCVPFQLTSDNRKRNLAEEFFRLRPHELQATTSTVKPPSVVTSLHAEDQRRDSLRSENVPDYAPSDTETHSQDSDFIIEENASTATHGANSETTRATFGSSHIVAYFSGDSSTESEDPDPLYMGIDQDDNSVTHGDTGSDAASPSNRDASPRILITPPPPPPPPIGDDIASPQNTLSELEPMNPDPGTEMIDLPILHSPPLGTIHPDSPEYMSIEPPNNANTQTDYNNGTYQQTDQSLFRMITDINEPTGASTQWNPPFDNMFDRNVLDLNQTKKIPTTQSQTSTSQHPSYSNQALILSKAFHFLVQQIVDLILHLNTITHSPLLYWKATDIMQSYTYIWSQMEPLLIWLIQIMDTNESQLRFGASFAIYHRSFLAAASSSDPSRTSSAVFSSLRVPSAATTSSFDFRSATSSRTERIDAHPINTVPPKNSQDTDSIGYLLSLARSAACEQKEFLPSLDLASLEYIAYILDAVLYLLKNQPDESSIIEPYSSSKLKLLFKFPTSSEQSFSDGMDVAPENSKHPTTNTKPSLSIRVPFKQVQTPDLLAQRLKQEVLKCTKQTALFYKRSPCLGFYGCPDPHHLAPLDTFPLAEMPQLLQPNIRREILFSPPQDPLIPDPIEKSPFHTMNPLTALLSLSLVKCSSQLKRLASHQYVINSCIANLENQPTKQLDLKRGCDVFMGRWRLTIELFCKLVSGVKNDSMKMLYLMEDFHAKEAKFRHEMEKLRMELAKEQRDLIIDIARERNSLIRDTFQQLFTFAESRKGLLTPLCVMQVKVSFKNEQGEGNGVARSFYTSFAEEILSEDKLPSLDGILTQCDNPKYRSSKRERKDSISREDGTTGWDDRMVPLSHMAPPFHPHSSSPSMSRQKLLYGARLYPNVARNIGLLHAGKVTGMLLELPTSQLTHILNNSSLLDRYVQNARELILAQGPPSSPPPSYDDLDPSIQPSDLEQWTSIRPNTSQHPHPSSTDIPKPKRAKSELSELAPLFFEPGKCGFYSPRPGRYTAQRSQAYICVGRIIGLCLLTNEVFPLTLNRHVLKYLLGKHSTICWHDYAFMDPVSFESMRKLLLLAEENKPEEIKAMDLTFQATFSSLESLEAVDLVDNGSSIPLTSENVEYYVKLYTEYRMTKLVMPSLLDMQLGLSEVIPNTYFSNLTPEDLRLLLNGCNSFNIESLRKIVVITNESRQETDTVNQFIKWFWSIVNTFTDKEKQDLLYFWTSSPNMPASMQSYQPEPSIHIRPPDEDHLPTANTCIARLYIPLYSCRSQLKTKLGMAIKTKNFGFV